MDIVKELGSRKLAVRSSSSLTPEVADICMIDVLMIGARESKEVKSVLCLNLQEIWKFILEKLQAAQNITQFAQFCVNSWRDRVQTPLTIMYSIFSYLI